MKDVHEVFDAAKSVIDCQNQLEFFNNIINLIAPESDKTITISTEVDVRSESPSKFRIAITIDEIMYILRKRIEKKEEELLKVKEAYESIWK